ncbi:MAG: peptide-methionine (R)-S-oxide reductase [Candidatus Marinimicrobia bacterium]|nr:peptide-methionine (R)-S-oxide reductase [Candidatus Neomarinimicrobiota bacterium]
MDLKNKTDKEWQSCLSPIEYKILRQKGTEPPGTGKYYKHNDDGSYHCAGCGTLLFSSDTKYDSGSGWPSFWGPIDSSAITEHKDFSLFMTRTEIKCSNCGGHLGHVFDDGPQPTGLRYCVNSASLNFQKYPISEK